MRDIDDIAAEKEMITTEYFAISEQYIGAMKKLNEEYDEAFKQIHNQTYGLKRRVRKWEKTPPVRKLSGRRAGKK